MAGVEHRLLGTRDGAQACSAAEWADEARGVIAGLHDRGTLPVLVGGTGLYLRTLLDGIAELPPIDAAIRAEVRSGSAARNHARLAALDPEAAKRLHPNDRQRVARALEVILSTGRKLRTWQDRAVGGLRDRVTLFGVRLEVERDTLNRRIDRRFADMIETGALDEVARLLTRSLPPSLPVMRAIGVPEIAAHLNGNSDLESTIALGQLATRQYAKRQSTWFRHQQLGLEPISPEAALSRLLAMAKEAGC